tara:strand:- start:180 stop:536 length:357 start_codon:yes stop_codon:yes gene_type:complete
MSEILEKLMFVLNERKNSSAKSSYVADLHSKGINKILEKVGEESTETIISAKDYLRSLNESKSNSQELKKEFTDEVADLWFHTLVLLSHLDIELEEVMSELEKRFGISGHAEKKSRKN